MRNFNQIYGKDMTNDNIKSHKKKQSFTLSLVFRRFIFRKTMKRMNEMNEIVYTFLLTGDEFMPETHLEQPGLFTYSACVPFTRNKERIQKFMQTGNKNYIYKTDLDKACFQHDMAYGKYKDLTKRT